jgi:pyruvate dehydrogenase E1 component alpha subunit
LPKFRSALISNRTMTEAEAGRIEGAARAEMEDAVNFALASPLPAPEDAVNYVYA